MSIRNRGLVPILAVIGLVFALGVLADSSNPSSKHYTFVQGLKPIVSHQFYVDSAHLAESNSFFIAGEPEVLKRADKELVARGFRHFAKSAVTRGWRLGNSVVTVNFICQTPWMKVPSTLEVSSIRKATSYERLMHWVSEWLP